ncbi:MAG TPA: hypothetical protein VM658_20955 [bacterium]|nr:hypothetical protein [bacterium]
MRRLPKPSPELARQVLAPLSFKRRLVGHRLHPRLGAIPVSLYSLDEIVAFLSDVYAQLDLDDLQAWARDSIADHELAAAISAVAASDSSPFNKNQRLRMLLETRLHQCRKISL